jgi:endonuclease III
MAPEKLSFDIDTMMARLQKATEPFPKAALFELADEGYVTPFEQVVACLTSIRTLDEVMLGCVRRLFQLARTPEEMVLLTWEQIDEAIRTSTFHQAKAHQILEIANQTLTEFAGKMPCDFAALTSIRGIGPKCANLVLGIACDQPALGVDIHVHRVTNRWGYVQAPTPEKTMQALEQKLPVAYWVEINRVLVPFGKHICTGRLPRCSTCPVLEWCRQVGVTKHR